MLSTLLNKFFKPDQALARPIVIVSGLPRSGTSLMMQMLAAGGLPVLTDSIRQADPNNPRGYYEFERVKRMRQGDLGWLPGARGKAVKIIAALLPYLPGEYDYRIIFLRRALDEVLASQARMLENLGEEYSGASDQQIRQLFERHLAQVDTWIARQPNAARLDIEHHDLIFSPLAQAERVNQFLGGLDVQAMAAVVEPSLYRQRKTGQG